MTKSDKERRITVEKKRQRNTGVLVNGLAWIWTLASRAVEIITRERSVRQRSTFGMEVKNYTSRKTVIPRISAYHGLLLYSEQARYIAYAISIGPFRLIIYTARTNDKSNKIPPRMCNHLDSRSKLLLDAKPTKSPVKDTFQLRYRLKVSAVLQQHRLLRSLWSLESAMVKRQSFVS